MIRSFLVSVLWFRGVYHRWTFSLICPYMYLISLDCILYFVVAHGPIVKGGAKDKLKDGWTKVKKGDMWKAP